MLLAGVAQQLAALAVLPSDDQAIRADRERTSFAFAHRAEPFGNRFERDDIDLPFAQQPRSLYQPPLSFSAVNPFAQSQ